MKLILQWMVHNLGFLVITLCVSCVGANLARGNEFLGPGSPSELAKSVGLPQILILKVI